MSKDHQPMEDVLGRAGERARGNLPRPTPHFRRRSWLNFQRALDPLAPPKPLRWRKG